MKAIEASGLSKSYILGETARHDTLRDTLMHGARALFKSKARVKEPFWALNDVSFDLEEGDVLGIIGRNGSGKSTLLKILSRITTPDKGEARIRGRVASLLEVGTGFHLELTGHENIFLNGAILGMSRQEIKKKYDEIVAFSEIEEFIDTPVKHYSSGMYVRLAFAVAAHLEPDILIVDEVLAVGDIAFQKKCLGRLGNVATSGRTVLFVSHNMSAVEQLCSRAMLLEDGVIKVAGSEVMSVIARYSHSAMNPNDSSQWSAPAEDPAPNPYFMPLSMRITNENGIPLFSPIRKDTDFWVEIRIEVKKLDPALHFSIGVLNESDTILFGSAHTDGHPSKWPVLSMGETVLRCKIPRHLLNEGDYKVELYGGILNFHFYYLPGRINPGLSFSVHGGLSDSPHWITRRLGILAPILEWTRKE